MQFFSVERSIVIFLIIAVRRVIMKFLVARMLHGDGIGGGYEKMLHSLFPRRLASNASAVIMKLRLSQSREDMQFVLRR